GRHFPQRVNPQALDRLPDFPGSGVKQGDEAEALLGKAAVTKQGPSKVADADDHGRPGAIDAKLVAQGGDQVRGGVADAGLAQVAQASEVFSNLRVVIA